MSEGYLDFSSRYRCGHKDMIVSAYFIGSSYEYRRNPEAKAVAARIQRYIKTNDTIGSHIQAVAPAPAPASVARTAPSPTRTFPSNSTLAPGSTHQRESKPPATPSRVIVPAHLRYTKGIYSFEHVVCGTCDHVSNPLCDATEVLTRGPIKSTKVFSRRFPISRHVDLPVLCHL
jgi:hypothetical protein